MVRPRLPLVLGLALTACSEAGGAPADAGVDAPVDLGVDLGTNPGPTTLTAPAEVVFPYTTAVAAATTRTFTLSNTGTSNAIVSVSLSGSSAFTLTAAPAFVPAGGTANVTVRFGGSATATVATGTVVVTYGGRSVSVALLAVVGASSLPSATYADVLASDGTVAGSGTTVALASAPFPDPSGSWTDASVRVFVPAGYDASRATHEVVLHFHGHDTTLASTLAAHRYEQHVHASGAEVILVVPQGPVNAASGNFGKLMTPSKTRALLDDVLVMLYRDGKLARPVLSAVSLTAHSGGYLAVAANLGATAVPATHVGLFDALYGNVAAFQGFALTGAPFRSNYTTAGGTLANNQALATTLSGLAVDVAEDAFLTDFLATPSVLYFADTTHARATRIDNAYGEQLRFAARAPRLGGRVELRTATASSGMATVTFLPPPDPRRTAIRVEASADGVSFATVATVAADARSANFGLTGTRYVRVRAEYDGAPAAQVSDTYTVTDDAAVLVVDAFDRVLGGSFSGLAHDFAARVGAPLGASTVSSRVLVEEAFALGAYSGVVWLAGDTSVDDRPISPDEEGVLAAYLDAGGALVVSGSEVGFAMNGDAFLSRLGAAYSADDANTTTATGVGPLAAVGAISFGGVTAPYVEDFPDVLASANGGVALLDYSATERAAVGRAGEAALVGFPLELVAEPTRTSLSRALLSFVGVTAP